MVMCNDFSRLNHGIPSFYNAIITIVYLSLRRKPLNLQKCKLLVPCFLDMPWLGGNYSLKDFVIFFCETKVKCDHGPHNGNWDLYII